MTLSLKELEKKFALYGADFNKWDDKDKHAAMKLIEQDSDAQHLYAEALALDNAMNTLDRISFDRELLERRIMSAIEDKESLSSNVIPLSKVPSRMGWGAALAMAASIALLFAFDVIHIPGYVPETTMRQPSPAQQMAEKTSLTEEEIQAALKEMEHEQQRALREEALLEDFFETASATPSESTESAQPDNQESIDPETEWMMDAVYGIEISYSDS